MDSRAGDRLDLMYSQLGETDFRTDWRPIGSTENIYRVVLDGTLVHFGYHAHPHGRALYWSREPTAEEWEQFWITLEQLQAWNWREPAKNDYRGMFCWKVDLKRGEHEIRREAKSSYPSSRGYLGGLENWMTFCGAVSRLGWGFPFGGFWVVEDRVITFPLKNYSAPPVRRTHHIP